MADKGLARDWACTYHFCSTSNAQSYGSCIARYSRSFEGPGRPGQTPYPQRAHGRQADLLNKLARKHEGPRRNDGAFSFSPARDQTEGNTTIARGLVGQACSHTPHPTQASPTKTFPRSSSFKALSPIGHKSTHTVQSTLCVRSHCSRSIRARPIRIASRDTTSSAPVGQAGMHARSSHTTHGWVSARMTGVSASVSSED